MQESSHKVKKPLGRGITIGCVIFIAALCAALAGINHFNYRRSLYKRYQAYITDILTYVDRHIDGSDLQACATTLERSQKFDELEKFMDRIKEDFDIHYLYILVPIRKDGSAKIMSVISAENYYDRYVDTEGNLYLGWISDDEYSEEDVEKLFEIMEQKDIVFFEEKTEWGLDYTGAIPLFAGQEKPYALLCVDVDITDISRMIMNHTVQTALLVVAFGAIFTLVFLFWVGRNVTRPIEALEERVVDFAAKSHGQRDTAALKFDPPEIHTENEVEDLAGAVNQMTIDMREYVEGIVKAERTASQMTELANKDALTGIRNKTAYDSETARLERDLQSGNLAAFGIAMVDLNFLKKINDTYGHERGNCAIKKLCRFVCVAFEHSPVFRIGGDEFVVVLKGHDLENYDKIVSAFYSQLSVDAADQSLEPWEKVSAAIGAAFYDSAVDTNVESVFKRADQKMYEKKKEMKAVRE